MVQIIPQPFLPVILGLITYKFRGPERRPVLCGDTPNYVTVPQHFPYSAIRMDTLTTS